jgi:hypothetical protein
MIEELTAVLNQGIADGLIDEDGARQITEIIEKEGSLETGGSILTIMLEVSRILEEHDYEP